MYLSQQAKEELLWWKQNVKWHSKKIRTTPPSQILITDASNEGSCAVKDQHSNVLEWVNPNLQNVKLSQNKLCNSMKKGICG